MKYEEELDRIKIVVQRKPFLQNCSCKTSPQLSNRISIPSRTGHVSNARVHCICMSMICGCIASTESLNTHLMNGAILRPPLNQHVRPYVYIYYVRDQSTQAYHLHLSNERLL